MKKIWLFLALVISLFSFEWSGKVNWAISYDLAKELAKKEHKLVMVDISKSDCPPCRYLATHVYNNDKIANFINTHFVPVFYLIDKDHLPVEVQNYFTGSTPTILFIKPNGELFRVIYGARTPPIFLRTIESIYKAYEGNR